MVIFHHITVVRFLRTTNDIYHGQLFVQFFSKLHQSAPWEPEVIRCPSTDNRPPTHRCEDVNQTMELERWKWGGVFLQHNNNSKQAKQESGCPEKTSDSSRECVYLWEASTTAAAAILMGMRERESPLRIDFGNSPRRNSTQEDLLCGFKSSLQVNPPPPESSSWVLPL